MTGRKWIILFCVLTGVVLLCAVGWAASVGTSRKERSESQRLVRSYFGSLARGDLGGAYRLVCTDETGIERTLFEQRYQKSPIRSFAIEWSGTWSNVIDGHGQIYRVHLTLATGATGVEEVRTQAATCIQYADTRTA